MRTAHVHIGMHKTGSSSIQFSLAKSDWPEHHYVRVGAPNHSIMLNTIVEDAPSARMLKRDGHSAREIQEIKCTWAEDLASELKAVEKPNIILSGEGLSGQVTSDTGVAHLKTLLAPHVDRILIYGYVRPPISYLTSAFQQRVKAGGLDTLSVSFGTGYRDRFERFDTVFGRENVTLIPFDRATLAYGDVVRDFGGRIGLKIHPDQVINRNTSLSLEATALLYARNKLGFDFGAYKGAIKDRNMFTQLVATIKGRKLRLSSNLTQPVLDASADQLDWIEDRLGVPLRDAPYDGPDAISSEADLLAVAAEQLDMVCDMLHAEQNQQQDPAARVAETLDALSVLQRARRARPKRRGGKRAS